MGDALVSKLAQQIVDQAIFWNWKFWLTQILLALVVGAATAYFSRYFGKRGETKAIEADLKTILEQVRQTTKVTEDVRSAVSHADWVAREWKTIRRTKLEELVAGAISVTHWLDEQNGIQLWNAKLESKSAPADKVNALASLYFPEMRVEASKLALAEKSALTWIFETRKATLVVGNNPTSHQQVLAEALPNWFPLYQAVLDAISDIQKKAQIVMKEIAEA